MNDELFGSLLDKSELGVYLREDDRDEQEWVAVRNFAHEVAKHCISMSAPDKMVEEKILKVFCWADPKGMGLG